MHWEVLKTLGKTTRVLLVSWNRVYLLGTYSLSLKKIASNNSGIIQSLTEFGRFIKINSYGDHQTSVEKFDCLNLGEKLSLHFLPLQKAVTYIKLTDISETWTICFSLMPCNLRQPSLTKDLASALSSTQQNLSTNSAAWAFIQTRSLNPSTVWSLKYWTVN